MLKQDLPQRESEYSFVISRHFVDITELRPGMMIDQSIMTAEGGLLVVRETLLTQEIIDELKKMQFTSVYVREGEEEQELPPKPTAEIQSTIRKERKNDPTTFALKESVKESVATSMSHIFNDVESPSVVQEASNISSVIMKSIEGDDAVAFNIDELKVCDEYTFTHCVEVATISMIIAKQMGFSQDDISQIGLTGLLHDIGKSKIPLEVLNKPGALTDEEFHIMKQHPVIGFHLLKNDTSLSKNVLYGVLQHHEKINGGGYPLGVSGEQVTPYARILAVADIFDALVSVRPYKSAFTKRDATEMIIAMTAELDIQVIRAFLNSVILYPVDSIVSLSTKEKAKVVRNNIGFPLRPVVVGLTSGTIYDLSNDPKCASIIIL